MEVWDLKTSTCLIMPSQLNKFGNSSTINIFFVIASSKLDFFQIVLLWKRLSQIAQSWKNVLKGGDVLLRGAQWRIGNRAKVSIWKDARLPSLEHPKIRSPVVDLFSKVSINSLFSPTRNTWNVDLLHQLFSNQEVELIKKIPLRQGL